MPKKREKIIGARSDELSRRIEEVVKASKGRVTASDIIIAAVEEKLDAIERTGIVVTLKPVAEAAMKQRAESLRSPSGGSTQA